MGFYLKLLTLAALHLIVNSRVSSAQNITKVNSDLISKVVSTVDWGAGKLSISGKCLSSTSPVPLVNIKLVATTWDKEYPLTNSSTTCTASGTFSLTLGGIPSNARMIRPFISFGSVNQQSSGYLIQPVGQCKLANFMPEEHHHGEESGPHGDHSSCGCEDGVVTVHGQAMKLPGTTRLIASNTKMSAILSNLGDNEVLEIDHGATLEYDVISDKRVRAIVVYGSLEFNPAVNTRLVVGDLIVAPTGKLTVGTEHSPVTPDKKAEILIADYAFNQIDDPYQLANSLIVLGELQMYGRDIGQPGKRLAIEPKATDRILSLVSPPTNWRVGDTIVLADIRQLPQRRVNYPSQSEYRKITDIQGTKITLDKPLSFDHLGVKLPDIKGALSITRNIEVINTSRNVEIRSVSPNAIRGHTLFTHRAKVDVNFASFIDLGRTTSSDLNNTECNAQGEVFNYGTNQLGRYPIHAHHLIGPENPSNTGYQFKLRGNNIEGALRWAVAVHKSSYGLITANVFHRILGVGLAFEDSEESYNDVIANRFIGSMPGQNILPETLSNRGGAIRDGVNGLMTFVGHSAIWDAPTNTVKDNEIYGAWEIGYQNNSYYVNPKTPKYRGADPAIPGTHINWLARRTDADNRLEAVPVGVKRNNYIFGAGVGVYIAWPRGQGQGRMTAYEKSPGVYERFIVANAHQGIHSYHSNNDHFIDFILVNDPKAANRYLGGSRYTVGFNFNNPSYEAANARVISLNAQAVIATPDGAADAEGVYAGTYVGHFHIGLDSLRQARNGALKPPENTTQIGGGIWTNWIQFRVNSATDNVARITHITDVELRSPSDMTAIGGMSPLPTTVFMNFAFHSTNSSYLFIRDTTLLEKWKLNGQSAPNLKIYYFEQDPLVIVPMSSNKPPIVGALEPNLTNEQLKLKYGTSIGGSLAPCNAAGGQSCDVVKAQAAALGIKGLIEELS